MSHPHSIAVVGGRPDGALLSGVRSVLQGADEAILCVAFANRTGVALLEDQLKALGRRARVLLTTAFGSSTKAALGRLSRMRCQVRILNPPSGTYHPKMYIGSHGRSFSLAIGSANLTSGLVKNVEVMTLMSGPKGWAPAVNAVAVAEDLWKTKAAISLADAMADADDEALSGPLLRKLARRLPNGTVVETLAKGMPNQIADVSPAGILIETRRSQARGTPPQLVEPWMLQLAWDYLSAHGELSNTTLLNELHVHRSSAVCAILATLDEVEVVSTRPKILLRMRPGFR